MRVFGRPPPNAVHGAAAAPHYMDNDKYSKSSRYDRGHDERTYYGYGSRENKRRAKYSIAPTVEPCGEERMRYENGRPSAMRDDDGVYRPLYELPCDRDDTELPRRCQKMSWLKTIFIILLLFAAINYFYEPSNGRHDFRKYTSLSPANFTVSSLSNATVTVKKLHANPTKSHDFKRNIFERLWRSSRTASVAGWSYNTSRNTRNYVFRENVTILNQPKLNCNSTRPPDLKYGRDGIYLLVIISSSMENFEARAAIRETWGNQSNYEILAKKFNNITRHFMNVNITDKLLNDIIDFNVTLGERRSKRDLTDLTEDYADGFDANETYDGRLRTKRDVDTAADDPRFDHGGDTENPDADKEFNNFEETQNVEYYDYQTELSNVMKIPSRGEKFTADDSIKNVVNTVKDMIKVSINDDRLKLEMNKANRKNQTDRFVKVKFLFLLGQSANENNTELQSRIDEESAYYGDVIQESFVDSYNNLTLKSVMLLKWAVTNCGNNVRYLMKTDDDMYINIPRLIEALQNKSTEHFNRYVPKNDPHVYDKLSESKYRDIVKQEKLLMGDLICDARPISDTTSKWYSPAYMYGGKVYPRYLSGTGYVMSYAAADALYRSALDTPLFHLEDIYVTGLCSQKAGIKPIDHPGFSYSIRKFDVCTYAYLITAHQVSPSQMRRIHDTLIQPSARLDHCEIKRILAKRNSTSFLSAVKGAIMKLPLLGSPKSFINGLVELGFIDKPEKPTTKKRIKSNNGCF